MADIFDRMSIAANGAFDNVGKSIGAETDEDLNLYRTLRPEHFQAIAKEYGLDATADYISEMEKRYVGR